MGTTHKSLAPSYHYAGPDFLYLQRVPKGVMYKKATGALEDRFGDQDLVTAYHVQLIWGPSSLVSPCRNLPWKGQLLLGGNKTLNEPSRGYKLSSHVSLKIPENEWHNILEKPAPSQTKEETTNILHAGAVGAMATFESSVATGWMQSRWSQNNIKTPFTRMITCVTGTYPWRINGDM